MLGVIGGLGPMATALFMEMVTRMTDASCDQEHIEMLVHSCPRIPDRTAYILGNSDEDPSGVMIQIGKALAEAGASCIAIPCITAHYFHRELSANIPVPIIHAVDETSRELLRHGDAKAGIMATDGTVRSRIFQQSLQDAGIEPVLPNREHQQYVMDMIYGDIKAGKPADMEKFARVSDYLRARGAQSVILGCTELSTIKEQHPIGAGYIDAMEVLAQRAVLLCGGKLKEQYVSLVTES